MSPVVFRPGIRPNNPAKRRLHLGQYLTGVLPTPPPTVDWDQPVKVWGVLGNDTAGDCFWAMAGHAIMTWTANAGTEVDPSTVDILRAYSEATGYDPADPSTDQGTVMQDGLDYWRRTGIPVGDTRHQIVAFAQIDHRSVVQMETAADLFGEVLLAIDFPASAMDQFNAGQPWDVVPGAQIEGGHAICSARYDSTASAPWTVITWGREQPVTSAFMTKYLSEAWVAISREWVEANGSTPSGLDLQALGADFALLTGDPSPFPAPGPAPTPPGPPPFPGGLVAAVQALAADPASVTWLTKHHHGEPAETPGLVAAVLAAASGVSS